MSRMLLYPFAGAAVGVLAAVVIVLIVGNGAPDTAGMILVIGTFLAGSGAIAGALVGVGEVLRGAGRAPVTRSLGGSETDDSV